MRLSLRFFTLLLCWSFSVTPSYAQIGPAISSLIAAKTASRVGTIAMESMAPAAISAGIAQQTQYPPYRATIAAASGALTGIITAGVLASTAPLWVVAVVPAVAAVAIPLAIDKALSWVFNTNGTVTYQSSSGSSGTDPATSYLSMTQGGGYYQVGYGSDVWRCGSAYSCVNAYAQARYGSDLSTVAYNANSQNIWYYFIDIKSWPNGHYESMGIQYFSSGAPASCSVGTNYKGSSCVSVPGYVPPTTTESMADAVSHLPPDQASKPISPELLAAIANAAWQAASATAGTVPYDPTAPITAADVLAWKAAGVASYPTVANALSSAIDPATGLAAIPLPVSGTGVQSGAITGTSATTNTATGSTTNLSLSIDWGIFSAADPSAPTEQNILDPIFNLWPDWKNFAFPAHASVCPTPSFVALNHTFVFDHMCQWVDQVRPQMEAAFAVAWAILCIFIVMGA